MTGLLPFESSVPDPAPASAMTKALTQVEAHADLTWLEHAYQVLRRLAQEQQELTTDDLWSALRAEDARVVTHDMRAVGPVVRRAARDGLIAPTDRIQQSVIGGGRWTTRIWRSCGYPPSTF